MTASDWVLLIVIPAVLIAAGVVLFLRGRAAHREATRIKGGFGGPPGSHDIGTRLGFDVDPAQERADTLAAQRQMLWGGILGGVGLAWLLVAVFTRLV